MHITLHLYYIVVSAQDQNKDDASIYHLHFFVACITTECPPSNEQGQVYFSLSI
jgi:hypothetical protein